MILYGYTSTLLLLLVHQTLATSNNGICQGAATQLLPHSSDCTKYVQCSNGVAHVRACPATLHWNRLAQRCDYAAQALCNTNAIVSAAGATASHRCVSGHYYRHESECAIFYYCQRGEKVLMKCAAYFHWHQQLQRCDAPHLAKCPYVASVTDTIANGEVNSACARDNNPWSPTRLPYPGDCTKFLTCVYGRAWIMHCPVGLLWSKRRDRCDYAFYVNCPYEEEEGSADGVTSSADASGEEIDKTHDHTTRSSTAIATTFETVSSAETSTKIVPTMFFTTRQAQISESDYVTKPTQFLSTELGNISIITTQSASSSTFIASTYGTAIPKVDHSQATTETAYRPIETTAQPSTLREDTSEITKQLTKTEMVDSSTQSSITNATEYETSETKTTSGSSDLTTSRTMENGITQISDRSTTDTGHFSNDDESSSTASSITSESKTAADLIYFTPTGDISTTVIRDTETIDRFTSQTIITNESYATTESSENDNISTSSDHSTDEKSTQIEKSTTESTKPNESTDAIGWSTLDNSFVTVHTVIEMDVTDNSEGSTDTTKWLTELSTAPGETSAAETNDANSISSTSSDDNFTDTTRITGDLENYHTNGQTDKQTEIDTTLPADMTSADFVSAQGVSATISTIPRQTTKTQSATTLEAFETSPDLLKTSSTPASELGTADNVDTNESQSTPETETTTTIDVFTNDDYSSRTQFFVTEQVTTNLATNSIASTTIDYNSSEGRITGDIENTTAILETTHQMLTSDESMAVATGSTATTEETDGRVDDFKTTNGLRVSDTSDGQELYFATTIATSDVLDTGASTTELLTHDATDATIKTIADTENNNSEFTTEVLDTSISGIRQTTELTAWLTSQSISTTDETTMRDFETTTTTYASATDNQFDFSMTTSVGSFETTDFDKTTDYTIIENTTENVVTNTISNEILTVSTEAASFDPTYSTAAELLTDAVEMTTVAMGTTLKDAFDEKSTLNQGDASSYSDIKTETTSLINDTYTQTTTSGTAEISSETMGITQELATNTTIVIESSTTKNLPEVATWHSDSFSSATPDITITFQRTTTSGRTTNESSAASAEVTITQQIDLATLVDEATSSKPTTTAESASTATTAAATVTSATTNSITHSTNNVVELRNSTATTLITTRRPISPTTVPAINTTTSDPRLPFRAPACHGANNLAKFAALDCQRYYQCFGGYAYLLNCYDNYAFNADAGKCVPIESTTCHVDI